VSRDSGTFEWPESVRRAMEANPMTIIRRPEGAPTIKDLMMAGSDIPKINDDPLFDSNGEVVVTFRYPTDYGQCSFQRRIDSETFDAVVNQLDDEGTQP
jgi:hypothetical protein